MGIEERLPAFVADPAVAAGAAMADSEANSAQQASAAIYS